MQSFENTDLEISINSVITMISFKIQPAYGFTSDELRTLLLDFMLDSDIMMSTTIYPSVSHTKRYISKFRKALSVSVQRLDEMIANSPHIARERLILIGPTENGFKRTQSL